MSTLKRGALVCPLLALGIGHAASADGWFFPRFGHHDRDASFNRITTLPNYVNNADPSDTTVSEITAATEDGKTLVYTDSPGEQIGFVDITNPYLPVHAGVLAMGGEPTSVAVLGNRWALVGVNTSASFTSPSGHLAVVDLDAIPPVSVAQVDLEGQPDAVAISPDGRWAAIAIENERDEEICVGGLNHGTTDEDDCEDGGGVYGGLPQTSFGNPAGTLAIVDLGAPDPTTWGATFVDLTGLAGYAPEDPEPEFVDINRWNQAVVTLQENNHIVIVDLPSGTVRKHYPAGTVSLHKVDGTEDGDILLEDFLADIPREPDAVAWVPLGYNKYGVATANEGDLFGGSRGWSIFGGHGEVIYDSGNDFEHIGVRHGHYPEDRSENKGTEPEAIEYAKFDGRDYVFVASERGSFIAVYELNWWGWPELKQVLPGPLGPEGLLAIPSRNLLVVSSEEDDPEFGVRSSIMIYKLGRGGPAYPQLVSANDHRGKPIGWSAMSGMVAKPGHGSGHGYGHGSDDELLAVWDSYYSTSRIFTIDASKQPAVVRSSTAITGGSGDFDPEGIAVAPDGTYWIASEGNASGSRPNRLLQTTPAGVVLDEIALPDEIEQCRAASAETGTLGSGFEGIAVKETSHRWWRWKKSYVLLVAQQRGWDYTTPGCEGLDDDLADVNPGQPPHTRIWIYDPESGDWDHISYELEPLPPVASWVGLSEITKVPGGYILIERDNRTGDFAELKTLVFVSHLALADGTVTADEKHVYDLLPDMLETNGWITDKPEGVAVDAKGKVYVVTDNDGVEDWSGETSFMRLGRWWELF